MKTGNIKINENGRVAFFTGSEIPTAFGCGGMKSIYDVVYPATTTLSQVAGQAAVSAITFDNGNNGDCNAAWVTTIAKDKDNWVDVMVDEKRTRKEGRLPRNVRRRVNNPTVRPGTPLPAGPTAASAATPTASSILPALTTPTMDLDPPDPKPKYRLQSELGKSIGFAEVGEKIMNAPITLAIKEFLAVSPEMSNYLHDQTRRKRIAVEVPTSATASTVEYDANVQAATVAASKPYYALPSGRAVVVLDDKVHAESFLDDGSELNVMSEDLYKELGHPIDENIQWRINGFDSRIAQELDEKYGLNRGGVLGVLHNVTIDVGGIEVKQHIFVVSCLPAKLILGRPWGRMTRAHCSNEDDGSYTIMTRSPDDMREVKFLASPAHHVRNREYVRATE